MSFDDLTPMPQFDILTEEGTDPTLGNLSITAMHVPGHTQPIWLIKWRIKRAPKKMAVFVGDTILPPDVGSALLWLSMVVPEDLYDSVQRLLALPDDTLLYLLPLWLPI